MFCVYNAGFPGDTTLELLKRFDRDGDKRIHFASAMTMLGKIDGASADDGTSYLELVSFLKSNGAAFSAPP